MYFFSKALLASSLPSEHLALTKTVVRLLRFRAATLPDFLDTVCWGLPGPSASLHHGSVVGQTNASRRVAKPCSKIPRPRHFEVTRSGEMLKAFPSRGQLQEKHEDTWDFLGMNVRFSAGSIHLDSFHGHFVFFFQLCVFVPFHFNALAWNFSGESDGDSLLWLTCVPLGCAGV